MFVPILGAVMYVPAAVLSIDAPCLVSIRVLRQCVRHGRLRYSESACAISLVPRLNV